MGRDGSDVRTLTSFPNPIFYGGAWSPDGRYLTACTNESENLQNIDIYLVAADGSGARRIFSSGDGTKDLATGWSPDGRSLAITSDAGGVNRPGILDIETGRVRWLGAEGVDETSGKFSPDGRSLVAVRNRDARIQPVVYDVETGGETVPVLPEGGSLNILANVNFALGGSAITLSYSTDATRPALLLHELASGETRTLLEPEYGTIDPAAFAMADDVYYPSFDGLRIHALLYRPRDIATGQRVPAIVLPHGGPTAQYLHGFDPYVQFLVNEGYAVLEPNIRGSTGYGVEFRDMALKDWGGDDLKDVVAGREYLAAQSFVDPERIGVFGISYGGFMTFIAMTKAPQYWKAGVAWVGVTDLLAMYEESMPHFKYFLRNQMGDPEKEADLWRDRSAVNFAHQMTGKLLIVHGINDPRCPISQARIFRDRLLELGKVEGQDFEYVELGQEGHASTDQEQRLRAFTLVADYFGRNL
jgi:dipeptidyl aminopeptidase/acylaminoacyl peptidase